MINFFLTTFIFYIINGREDRKAELRRSALPLEPQPLFTPIINGRVPRKAEIKRSALLVVGHHIFNHKLNIITYIYP
jgi:hypothetical protein